VLTFLARRLIGMALVLVVVSFVVFLIFIVVPGGDPAVRIAGRTANDQNIANIRQTWGFDEPFYVQYASMMKKALNGLRPGCCTGQQDELRSQTNQLNVVDQIRDGLPATLSLSLGAALIWVFFGVLVGIIAAATAGRWSDRLITLVALVGISMPVFWLGIIARYYLAEGGLVTLFPDGEYVPLTEDPVQWFWHLLLPWFVLAVLFIGFYGRVMRGNILDTINEDFVRTARAKGLDPRRVMLKHVLRNSLIPIVTLFGLDFAAVLGGGAILTETVFDLHGVGQYAAQSIRNFDLPPIMGVTLYGAFFIVLFSAIVDLLYAYLDPRIRPT
jgi:peptide/nickel transport system permease protein